MDGAAKSLNVEQVVTAHLQVLLNALTDPDESRRSRASAYAVSVIKDSLLQRVVKELGDFLPCGGSLARQASSSLADIGQPAVVELVSRVKNSQVLDECIALIEALGTIGVRLGSSERIELCFDLEQIRDMTPHPALAAALDRTMRRVVAYCPNAVCEWTHR